MLKCRAIQCQLQFHIPSISTLYIIPQMRINSILLMCAVISLTLAAPINDRVSPIPGYPANFSTDIYSGYLDLGVNTRSAHYVFVQSVNKSNDPVTLWLNGGPGCSSLLGFIQEIGPYYLEDGKDYKDGDMLTPNPYSWHKLTNLLFLQSPPGVGFSQNNDTKYVHTDGSTAQDNMNALIDFFKKFPQYTKNQFWIAGQSYAGKYIPDLSLLIDKYNQQQSVTQINFKGILVGNGIMSFQHLQMNRIEYLIKRNFVDPQLVYVFESSCKQDPGSAGCRFAYIRIMEDTEQLNPYNVFGYCYYNDSFQAKRNVQNNGQIRIGQGQDNNKGQDIKDKQQSESIRKYTSQESILLSISKQIYLQNAFNKTAFTPKPTYNAAPCSYFDGMYHYFNLHRTAYHARSKDMEWNGPCALNISYQIDPAGSMEAYRYLLGRVSSGKKYSITLYSGDWDAVVPYIDTLQGLRSLNLVESYLYNAWFTGDQHSGFEQLFSGILFVSFKGASHQVPQSKRAQALQLLYNTFQGFKEDTVSTQ